jgi:hypothetical protein
MEVRKKFILKKGASAAYVYKTPIAAEVDALIREWYANLGQTISPEELKICREIDLAEVAQAARIEAAATASSAKPVYGTPEFWKAYWAKKKAGGATSSNKATKAKQKPASLKCAK